LSYAPGRSPHYENTTVFVLLSPRAPIFGDQPRNDQSVT